MLYLPVRPQLVDCVQFGAQCFKRVIKAPPKKYRKYNIGVNLGKMSFGLQKMTLRHHL